MANEPMIRRRDENMFFVHNCFGSFFKGVLTWFNDKVYPKFNYSLIGTYDKSVEYFKRKKELNRESEVKMTPCITLDPLYDFSNEERGGRFLWQFSRYAPGIGMRVWNSIDLKEQDILVTPVFSRYQGTFEVLMWLDSVYELMDLRVAILQLCGGYGRWLRPEYFWSYMVFPDAISNYKKDDGTNIDWGNTYADVIHVDTINQHKLAIPFAMNVMWKLDSFNDSSTKYGADRIAEYKLSASFSYEVNLPTYMVLSDKVDPQLVLSFSVGDSYTKYPLVSPYKILKIIQDMDHTPSVDNMISRNFNCYNVSDPVKEATSKLVTFHKTCLRYPLIAMSWNHICSGKLILVNDETIASPDFKVSKDDIIYMESYKDSYLPYLRKAKAAISYRDSKISKFYNKCVLLNKPMVCFISEEEANIVESQINLDVTLDPFKRILYSGILDTSVSEQDPVVCYEILKDIKEEYPELYDDAIKKIKGFENFVPQHYAETRIDKLNERLISDNTDGITTLFPLNYLLDDSSLESLLVYIDDNLVDRSEYEIINKESISFLNAPPRGSKIYIGGELLVIKDCKLAGIYTYTEDDEKIGSVLLDLPRKLENVHDVVLISYIGKLENGLHYTINIEDQSVNVSLKPKKDEIIQFFYYLTNSIS